MPQHHKRTDDLTVKLGREYCQRGLPGRCVYTTALYASRGVKIQCLKLSNERGNANYHGGEQSKSGHIWHAGPPQARGAAAAAAAAAAHSFHAGMIPFKSTELD